MGVLQIMSVEHGDEPLEWDPAKPKQVEKARKVFAKKIAEGFTAYAAKEKVERTLVRGRKLKEFNPGLSRILLAAPMQGGPVIIER